MKLIDFNASVQMFDLKHCDDLIIWSVKKKIWWRKRSDSVKYCLTKNKPDLKKVKSETHPALRHRCRQTPRQRWQVYPQCLLPGQDPRPWSAEAPPPDRPPLRMDWKREREVSTSCLEVNPNHNQHLPNPNFTLTYLNPSLHHKI